MVWMTRRNDDDMAEYWIGLVIMASWYWGGGGGWHTKFGVAIGLSSLHMNTRRHQVPRCVRCALEMWSISVFLCMYHVWLLSSRTCLGRASPCVAGFGDDNACVCSEILVIVSTPSWWRLMETRTNNKSSVVYRHSKQLSSICIRFFFQLQGRSTCAHTHQHLRKSASF